MLVSALAGREHVLRHMKKQLKRDISILQLWGCDVYRIDAESDKCEVMSWGNREIIRY